MLKEELSITQELQGEEQEFKNYKGFAGEWKLERIEKLLCVWLQMWQTQGWCASHTGTAATLPALEGIPGLEQEFRAE